MNLVIVESPAKAKTIEKYLGKDFKVLASFGHVRDLPANKLSIDVKNDYKPDYAILPKAKKTIAALKQYSGKADIIYLATDLDREGEAISWHLTYALGLKKNDPRIKRIVFHEITKTALEHAVNNPRTLDYNLIDAQQARRVLDRLVGYKLSPMLWQKVKMGLSAGRVQSVAVRLVVDKENDIKKFVPVEYWVMGVNLKESNKPLVFPANLVEAFGKSVSKMTIKTKEEADRIANGLVGAIYTVLSVKHEDSIRRPSAPFTTSTLQMEASRKLGYSPKQTMVLAQHLYEAGHITYMRTDSLNLSGEAVAAIKSTIANQYGEKFIQTRSYATKAKHAQEAHEAIRPTHFDHMEVIDDRRGQKLYELIWKRTVATQMADAIFDVITAKIEGKKDLSYVFAATGEAVKFEGFMKVYTEGRDEETDDTYCPIPEIKVGETLDFVSMIQNQKYTEPPKRYTEATLVKRLEGLGIGRPSTYAPTLETIQNRGYVELIEKKFQPTEIGNIVTDLLVEHFPSIVDYQFTADMEDQFDEIAEGHRKWQKVIDDFYIPFAKNLADKMDNVEKTIVISETPCPHCGKMMLVKFGRMGKFLACPEEGSKVTLPLPEEAAMIRKLEIQTSDELCPLCGKEMLVKRGRFGYFLGCSNYPECKGISKIFNKTGFKCPNCKTGDIVEKKSRGRGKTFFACSRWPDCNFIMNNKPENEAQVAEALKAWQENPPKIKVYNAKAKAPSKIVKKKIVKKPVKAKIIKK